MNLNELRDQAYKIACEHGFHDTELSNEHWLCLVISELMEAVEADRKGNYCHSKISSTDRYTAFPTEESRFKKEFSAFVKDTVEDELSDGVIRLLDLAGLRGVDIDIPSEWIEDMQVSCESETFTESIYDISIIPCKHELLYSHDIGAVIRYMMIAIFGLAKHLDINLLWHIEQKMKYNQLREKMHGKKY